VTVDLPAGLDELLPAHLSAQRWYAGHSGPRLERVEVEVGRLLWSDGSGRSLWHAIVLAGGDRYQLVVGERPTGEPADFLHGREAGTIAALGRSYFYDATLDAEMGKVLLQVASDGKEAADRARPVQAEQSNTSLVFDDRIILKLFRRLHAGRNPDVEVTTALAAAGFTHVAEPIVTWRDYDFDLAFGQQYLVGGSEGWALALTSLRDLYNSPLQGPAESGGDFSAEAARLGGMTAGMHLALAKSFGVSGASRAVDRWQELVATLGPRLDAAADVAGRDLVGPASALLDRLRAVSDPGPFLRVHGDYHLGQVMRTDTGWFVLDFEGEPAKLLSERTRFSSPFKDVSSMLRSFHYATRQALVERPASEVESLGPLALAWETHNRQAFLDGYRRAAGIEELLPPPEESPAILIGYELDKALYEVDYERAHRPDWVSIPLDALDRLLHGGDQVG
jgi:maltokinase